MVAPPARRTVFMVSSTGTSLGSTLKIRASVSAWPSESSSSGVWTRASSSYSARRGRRRFARASARRSSRNQTVKSARRGRAPVRASRALNGQRYSGACQTARSRLYSQRRKRFSMLASIARAYYAAAMERAILHVDMDAFYASVEQRDDPRLRGKPVAVGGASRRGVVCAASYEARPFGVRSAMPMGRALRLCPQLIVVPPDFTKYSAVSDQVFEIFHSFTPEVEGLSLDEAFLDVTHSQTLLGAPRDQALGIKARILERTRLTASVGIAEVKFAAKIASELCKPDGLLEVPRGQVREFLAPLPATRLWGVGARTDEQLQRLGLRKIGDVAQADVAYLEAQLGSAGPWLHDLANGIDPR